MSTYGKQRLLLALTFDFISPHLKLGLVGPCGHYGLWCALTYD